MSITALMLERTNWVGSYTMRLFNRRRENPADSSFMAARTWSETAKALAPGDCMMASATAGLLFSSERKPYSDDASSTRATSPSRVTPPSGES